MTKKAFWFHYARLHGIDRVPSFRPKKGASPQRAAGSTPGASSHRSGSASITPSELDAWWSEFAGVTCSEDTSGQMRMIL